MYIQVDDLDETQIHPVEAPVAPDTTKPSSGERSAYGTPTPEAASPVATHGGPSLMNDPAVTYDLYFSHELATSSILCVPSVHSYIGTVARGDTTTTAA